MKIAFYWTSCICIHFLLIRLCLCSDQSTVIACSPLLRQHNAQFSYCCLMPATMFSFSLPYQRSRLALCDGMLETKYKGVRLWGWQQEVISKPQHHNDRCVFSVSPPYTSPTPLSLQCSSKRNIKAFGLFAYYLHPSPNWLFLDARRLGSLFITWECNLFFLFVAFASDYYVPQLRPGNKRPDDLNCFSSTQECKCSRRPN